MTHNSTFEFLSPSDTQRESMARCRAAAADYAKVLEKELPEGEDRDHAIRMLRTAAMWANIAITRFDDGSPRR